MANGTCYLRQGSDEIVRAIEEPRRNAFHGKWYVAGHRWIKSRQNWSGSALMFLLGDFVREVPCPDAPDCDGDADYHREQARAAELARRGASDW